MSKGSGSVAGAGDWVTLTVLPPFIEQLPPHSQAVFRFCLGKTFRVEEIDEQGLLVLDVSPEVDKRFGGYMNDIRGESEFVALAERPDRA